MWRQSRRLFRKYSQYFHLIQPKKVIVLGGVNDVISLYESSNYDSNSLRIVSDLLDKKTKSRPPYKNPGPREARQRLSTAFNFFQTLSTSESTPTAHCYMQPWLDFSNSFD